MNILGLRAPKTLKKLEVVKFVFTINSWRRTHSCVVVTRTKTKTKSKEVFSPEEHSTWNTDVVRQEIKVIEIKRIDFP